MTDSAPPLPEAEPAPKGRGARLATIVVAFSVFALAAGVFVVPALRMRSGEGPQAAASGATSYPPPPLTGYYVLFPSVPDGGRVIAITNLPEGTRYSTTAHVYGPTTGSEQEGGGGFGCCPSVHNGYMGAEAWNESCNNPVGSIGNSSGFDVTIEVRSDFSGEMGPSPPDGFPPDQTSQPDSVLTVLGSHLENLTGDQVKDLPNGGKEIVATASYSWTEPQCDQTYPLWGGDPDCTPGSANAHVDLRELKGAMDEVIGTISQARMCEFWQTMLTNDGRAKHLWPEFSDEWSAWYRVGPKDFSALDPGSSPLTWRTISGDGQSSVVDVFDRGTPVLELRMTTLQDCACAVSMTPPWHVASWTFLA